MPRSAIAQRLACSGFVALVFATALGLPVQVLDELSEVDHGEPSGLTRAEIAAACPGRPGPGPDRPFGSVCSAGSVARDDRPDAAEEPGGAGPRSGAETKPPL